MLDIGTWSLGAVIVVGLIQWVKGLAPKAASWVWAAALPMASIATAMSYGFDKMLWNALGICAFAQVCYEVILQTIKAKVGTKSEAAEPKLNP